MCENVARQRGLLALGLDPPADSVHIRGNATSHGCCPSLSILVSVSALEAMVFAALVSLGLTLSPSSTSQGLTRPPAARRRHASVTSIAVDAEPAIRIGHGYDIHRLDSKEVAGQPLVIAGVKFDGSDAPDFKLGCVAHSDGDVVYHSVVRCSPARTRSNRARTGSTAWRRETCVPTGGRDFGRADDAGHRPALSG